MSGSPDASQFISYDPNTSSSSSKRRRYGNLPPIPVIPAAAPDAENYRLSPTQALLSPLALETPLQLHDFPSSDTLYSPTSSPTLLASFQRLQLEAQRTPHPSPPARQLSRWEHVDAVLDCILDHFPAFGDFAEAFIQDIPRAQPDPRSTKHKNILSKWLAGMNRFGPVDFTQAAYSNRYSVPHSNSVHADEINQAFNGECAVDSIHFTRIALSIWATSLVGRRCSLEIKKLGKEDPNHPDFRVHLRASANERMKEKRRLVSEEDIFSFNMKRTASVLKARAPLAWYLTECMAASRKHGEIVQRKYRPHENIQTVALSSFALGRNKSANGFMAFPMGVYYFATKTHTDVKRIESRLGHAVSDSTARAGLQTMGAARLAALRESTAEALERGEPYVRKVLDNIQQYNMVHEPGIGKANKLVTGTACTAIILDDCEPGAFNVDRWHEAVVKNERATLSLEDLQEAVDHSHLHIVKCLHVTRILVQFIPRLSHLSSKISERFRTAPVAQHRMREGRKTRVVPLGANSHQEMETNGMKDAQKDFDTQVGHTPEATVKARCALWDGGDGGSVLSGARVIRHRLPQLASQSVDIHTAFANRFWTPGLWHQKATMINSLATNYYGPATTKDPSALRRLASATNMYIPTKTDSCNFYPAVTLMTTACEAQILDAWDLYLTGHTGLDPYFEKLAERDALPSLDNLLVHADTIVKRYASTTGYRVALSSSSVPPPTEYKFPVGPPWTPSSGTDDTVVQEGDCANADADLNANADEERSDSEDDSGAEAEAVDATEGGTGKKKMRKKKKKKKKRTSEEEKGFKGDRCLANSILFRRDFLLWIELSYAIADGDIGRVMKVLMIWIFLFAGAGNRNYVNLLLELYCLFRYEASKEMKDAIWNNWLVNITGELGKWIEDDLLQEHYNKWLEDMLAKHGGRFDDDFFRYTISPNVDFFLRLREELEAAYELAERGKSHTSAHLRDEYRIMMTICREDYLNYIRSARSMGHIAVDLEDAGYEDLDDGKYTEFQERSTEHATVLDSLLRLRKQMESESATSTSTPSMSTAPTAAPAPTSVPTSSSRDLSDSESEIEAGSLRSESGWVFRFDGEEVDDEPIEEDEDGDDIDYTRWENENDEY